MCPKVALDSRLLRTRHAVCQNSLECERALKGSIQGLMFKERIISPILLDPNKFPISYIDT